ncbi:hypothetical protein F01_440135 [Burkholderia cenocepacia]|nr:hypothetical protein F01_440135 [Burkholderia cenocepacia]
MAARKRQGWRTSKRIPWVVRTRRRERRQRAPDHSRAHSVCATHAAPNHANLIFKSGLIISIPHDPGVNLRSIPARPCAGTSLHRRPR